MDKWFVIRVGGEYIGLLRSWCKECAISDAINRGWADYGGGSITAVETKRKVK